jgi:hypothetical protein
LWGADFDQVENLETVLAEESDPVTVAQVELGGRRVIV